MDEFIKKISTYNLFVNFIPGCIFVWYLQEYKGIELTSNNDTVAILILTVLSYTVGLIVNRISSLVIEPMCQKSGLVKFAPYDEYSRAEKKDEKIKILSEINNFYRSLAALSCVMIITEIFSRINNIISFVSDNNMLFVALFAFLIFLLSYRSQTRYVVSRVAQANSSDDADNKVDPNERCYTVRVKRNN